MQYLDSFTLASERDEAGFLLSFPSKLEMSCYSDCVYPFKIFPEKKLERLEFSQVTLIYGGNGSGKSTLLNIIAEKLSLGRGAPFNYTPYFEDYTELCDFSLTFGKKPPDGSKIITSSDVFDFLLDFRALNDGVDNRRRELFSEYEQAKNEQFRLRSLDDYNELKRRREAKTRSASKYIGKRLSENVEIKSNGESSFAYFTNEIRENALYLLDEPENSLSVPLQLELLRFIEDSVRFYNCQFVISSHSPFLLSLVGAKIYDLDSVPVCVKKWTELENIRAYYDFFRERKEEFEH